MKRINSKIGSVVETMEARQLMSAAPLAISQIAMTTGTELRIQAGAKSDKITLTQTGAGLVVTDGKFSQTIAGQFCQIDVFGGAGADSILVDASVSTNCNLYGGAGRNVLQAGSGTDTLDSIGSTADTLIGGSGMDSFWTDNSAKEKIVNESAAEMAVGAVHRVSSFYTGPAIASTKKVAKAKAKASAVLTEPATTDGSTYANFSSNPLFSNAGPAENDIVQGDIGDCYFLSVLSSTAKINPQQIRQSILDMGDGTYLVQFHQGSSTVDVHVDGELPVNANGSLDYAGLGAQNSTWVAIMEKAFTVFHGTTASYASIDGGWMDESYAALGDASTTSYAQGSPTTLMTAIQADLAAGQSVTFGTISTITDGASLIGGHAYTVDSVVVNSHGVVTGLTLRNPWGVDGIGNDGSNDGYVTISATQAYVNMVGMVNANV